MPPARDATPRRRLLRPRPCHVVRRTPPPATLRHLARAPFTPARPPVRCTDRALHRWATAPPLLLPPHSPSPHLRPANAAASAASPEPPPNPCRPPSCGVRMPAAPTRSRRPQDDAHCRTSPLPASLHPCTHTHASLHPPAPLPLPTAPQPPPPPILTLPLPSLPPLPSPPPPFLSGV